MLDFSDRSAQIKAVLRATYNAAADHFDDAPLSFWDRCGRRTVEFAGIEHGDAVLDVCCGAGGSALPAAERVGPAGRVVGIDLAERLLDRARAKARERQLDNAQFVAGDLTCLDVADDSFDVVLCVFGIFLAPDMSAAAAELWRTLRPGGTLVVTTWGTRLFEPANAIYWDAVEAERPDLRPATLPQHAIAEPAGLTRLFTRMGAPAPEIECQTLAHPAGPEDFWTIVQGSGHRLPLDLMGAEAAGRVRTAVMERLARERLTDLSSDVLYARAHRS